MYEIRQVFQEGAMELWTIEGNKDTGFRWEKKEFAPFPLPNPDNLVHRLLSHWQEHSEPHFIVFSEEEVAKIIELGGPFNGSFADGFLRDLVVKTLLDNRRGFVTATYVPVDNPDHTLGSDVPMRLCMEFNRPGF